MKPREIYCEKCQAYYVVGQSNCKDEDCPVQAYLKKEGQNRIKLSQSGSKTRH